MTADLVSAAESLGLSIRALTSDFAEIDNRSAICSARRVDGVRALLCVPAAVLCATVEETAAAKGRVGAVEECWL